MQKGSRTRDIAIAAPRVGAAVIALMVAVAACGGGGKEPAPSALDASATDDSKDAEAAATETSAAEADQDSTKGSDGDSTTTSDDGDADGTIEFGSLPFGRLVFDSDRSGNIDIWVIDANAPEPQQLTTDEGADRVASWSPDGSTIVFTSDRGAGALIDSPSGLRSYALYTASDLGIAELPSNQSFNGIPAYSPDGSQIAFGSDLSGAFQIYVMPSDGSGSPEVVTEDPVQAASPSWSPDGTRLLFSSLRDGDREIYVIGVDGSAEIRLTDDPADDSSAVWSPDGTMIAFHSDRDGNNDIYVMNVNGSGQLNITNDPARDAFPSWIG